MVFSNQFVVSIKCNGKVLREQQDKVFLPFGSEYSILLKNLSSKKSLVTIEIDGENVLDNYQYVINENETKELKRFIINGDLNIGPTFKFIERNESIEKNRGVKLEDGIIRITYQFADLLSSIITSGSYIHPYHYNTYPTFSVGGCCSRGIGGGGDVSPNTTSVYSASCNSLDGASNTSNVILNENINKNDNGITVKGKDTNQKFNISHDNYTNYSPKYSICVQLKGYKGNNIVEKPLEVDRKLECSVCHVVNRSINKFCRECGNNLNY